VKTILRLLLTFLSLFTYSVYATDGREEGGVSGGGGNAIVCERNGEIQSVELLDLYEGREGHPVQYYELSGDLSKDFAKVSSKIYPDDRDDYKLNQLGNSFIVVLNNLKDIPSDAEFTPTDDTKALYLPKGCVLKPVINYFSHNEILIDRNLFNRMDYRNQLALYLHETLYLEEREQGVVDSRYIRKLVGQAFQNKTMITSHDYLFQKTELKCVTQVDSQKSVFYITKKEKGLNTIFFEQLNGHNLAVVSFFQYDFNPEASDFGLKKQNVTTYVRTFMQVDLEKVQGKLYLSFRGEKGDNFFKQPVTCSAY
jgi:hypothetical protein